MKIKVIDFLLWPISLLLLYLITHLTMTGVFYGFEFLIRFLSKLKPFFYILLIFPVISLIFTPAYLILSILSKLTIGLFVRQWKALTLVFGILFSIEIIIFVILFWIGIIEFSWESLRYSKLNKAIFYMLCLTLIYVPITVYVSLSEDENMK